MKTLYSTVWSAGLNFALSTVPTVWFSYSTGLPTLAILLFFPASFRRSPLCPAAVMGGRSDTVNFVAASLSLPPGASEI